MIQTWADENGERARPSDPTIAKSSGLVRSTIANHVKKLHDSGWLSIRSNRGRTHSNTYTLTIPAVYEVLIEQTLGKTSAATDLMRKKTSSSVRDLHARILVRARSRRNRTSIPALGPSSVHAQGALSPDRELVGTVCLRGRRRSSM
jgi:hypothetical protein